MAPSSVRHFDYIVQAVKRAGPRKILFGSDGPWLHPGVEIHKVRLLGLPPAAEALILGANSLRLISRVSTSEMARRTASTSRPRSAASFRMGSTPADGELEVTAMPESEYAL
jgi:hypothetical protein